MAQVRNEMADFLPVFSLATRRIESEAGHMKTGFPMDTCSAKGKL